MQVLLQPLYLYCFGIIFFATIAIEISIRQRWLHSFIGRKLLHIIAVGTCGYCIHTSTHRVELSYAFLFFSFVLFILIRCKLFASNNTSSYGIALFPLAFFVLLQLPFLHKHTITFAVLTLAFADAAAGYIGNKYGRQKIIFLAEEKSWLGIFTFFIVTALLYLRYFGLTFPALALLVAFIPAIVEAFSYKGSDNFTVPIITALWLYCIQVTPNTALVQKTVILIIIIALAVLAWYKSWLSTSGTVAALFIGIVVVFIKDAMHLMPLAFFLITGTLASRLNKTSKKDGGRNALQVFANGIVALICLGTYYFNPQQIFYIAFFASIAISMTDTISSEIGKYCKQTTYDIITTKRTAIGLSGGISVAGTLGGVVASCLFALMVYTFFPITVLEGCIIGLVGFIGMLVDSVLGSTIQAKYTTSNNTIVEEKAGTLVKGFTWCTNDGVNILANGVTIIFYYIGVTIC